MQDILQIYFEKLYHHRFFIEITQVYTKDSWIVTLNQLQVSLVMQQPQLDKKFRNSIMINVVVTA